MEDQVFEIKIPTETETDNSASEKEDVVIEQTEVVTEDENFNPIDYLKDSTEGTTEVITSEEPLVEKQVEENKENAYSWAEKNNRSPEDYFKLHKDWKNENNDLVLRTYLKEKNPFYTDQDIQDIIDEKYSDDDLDDDLDKRKKQRLYKEDVADAKTYLSDNFNKDAVKQDAELLEIPQEYKNAFQYVEEQKTFQKQAEQARNSYMTSLEDHYKDFKGYDFNFDVTDENGAKKDVSLSYEPNQSSLRDIIDVQKNTNKLLEKFGTFKEDGTFDFNNSKEFFKVIAFASDMNNVLRMAYEQGASSAVENLVKDDLKRVNISSPNKQNPSATGIKFSVE